MNSRIIRICFAVLFLVLILSVKPAFLRIAYAGDNPVISESTELDFFEIQTTVMEVHQKNNYIIAGEKVIQLLDFRKGRKRFRTMLRNTGGEETSLNTFTRGQKVFIRGFELPDGTIKARGIYQLPETVVTAEGLRKFSFAVKVPVWEPTIVE